MNVRSLSTVAGAATLAALAACSSTPLNNDAYRGGPTTPVYSSQPAVYDPPAVYNAPPVYNQGPAVRAEYGTVRSIQLVSSDSRATGAGAVLGAVVGGVVGHQFGSGTGRTAATIAGAVGGGVAGNEIEKRTQDHRNGEVFQVGVQFDDGSYRTFNFRQVGDLRIGDRVSWDSQQLAVL